MQRDVMIRRDNRAFPQGGYHKRNQNIKCNPIKRSFYKKTKSPCVCSMMRSRSMVCIALVVVDVLREGEREGHAVKVSRSVGGAGRGAAGGSTGASRKPGVGERGREREINREK